MPLVEIFDSEYDGTEEGMLSDAHLPADSEATPYMLYSGTHFQKDKFGAQWNSVGLRSDPISNGDADILTKSGQARRLTPDEAKAIAVEQIRILRNRRR